MKKFSTNSFLEIIEDKKDELIQNKINDFIAHIKTHSFVKACSLLDNSVLDISFSESIEMPEDIGDLFILGGTIKKTSAVGKEELDENDFFYIRSYNQ